MPSKNTKKTQENTCQHVFTLGDRKGTKCGKNCRDGYCYNHKKYKKQYKAKWFQEQQQKKKEETTKDALNEILNCTTIDELPSVEQLRMKKATCRSNYIYLHKKLIGYEIKNHKNQDKQIELIRKFQHGACICTTHYQPSHKEISSYRKTCSVITFAPITDYDLQLKATFGNKYKGPANRIDKPDTPHFHQPYIDYSIDKIIRNIQDEHKCMQCSGYTDSCKFCSSKNHIFYFPAKRTLNDEQLEKIRKKIQRIKEKYERYNELLEAAELMEIKLSEPLEIPANDHDDIMEI